MDTPETRKLSARFASENSSQMSPVSQRPIPLTPAVEGARDYPVAALGPILGNAVKVLAENVQAPEALCAQSAIAAAALCVQSIANIGIDGRTHPLSHNCITIAESGERKSALDKIVCQPIDEYEKELEVIYQMELNEAIRREREKKTKKKEGNRPDSATDLRENFFKDAEAVEKELLTPKLPQIRCEEPTYEGLVRQLDKGRSSLGIFSDEGGKMLGGYSMGKDHFVATISGLSLIWDGSKISFIRKGSIPLTLRGRRLSIHLQIQPVVAASLISNDIIVGQGFLARSLFVMPPTRAGTRPYREWVHHDDVHVKALWDRISKAIRLPLKTDASGALQLRKLSLSAGAKERWKNFYNHVEKELDSRGEFHSIRAFGSKAAEHVLRLAGVLTLIEDLNAEDVPEEVMERATTLVEFYLYETLRIFNGGVQSNSVVYARRLLEWIQKTEKKAVTLRDICNGGPNSLRQKDRAQIAARTLEEYKWLLPIEFPDPHHWQRKQRSVGWRVNHE